MQHLLSMQLSPPPLRPKITVMAPVVTPRAADPEALAAAQRGQACEHDGHFEEARALYRRALKIDPDCAVAKMYLGFLHLAQGEYTRAWPLTEFRETPKHQGAGPPRWAGENLRGKTLAVILEAGLGDQIQFARFVPLLRPRGGRIVMMCPSELARVYRSLAGVAEAYDLGKIPTGDVKVEVALRPDYYIELCSLPHILKSGTIPQPPYLRADPADIARWRPLLPQTGLRVGLVWRGSPSNVYDPWRSLPSLSVLAPLWGVPDVSFVSLQKGAGEDEARSSALPLTHLGGDVKDMADTAAVLAQLDLLISIDTSTAHLAGALGRPTWLILDRVPDWRYRSVETLREWYPSARGFYQHVSGDWRGAVADVEAALSNYAQERRSV